MADGMKVDPEALRARSPKFAAAADKLSKAFEDLKVVQDAEGPCWGDDEPGTQFNTEYTKALDEVNKGREFLVKSLDTTKDELDKTADQWQSDDEGSAENIDNAGSAI
ncbi:WXG100 family type VII secretion target [Saccharopolyspora sp. 5N708]|uniref:WXG100 family type VII secretion target n=1 Tax=Saccharopolyspora sp. 5N708 TaxID=3457424 RepID=UPI003FD2C390